MKQLSILFLLLAFTASAQAKVTSNKKLLHELHVLTIKGFLYEMLESQETSIKKQVAPKFARAIVWFEKIHKHKKTYEIWELKTEDASLIKGSIRYISDMASGDHGGNKVQIEDMLNRWYIMGKHLVAEYKEKKGKVSWKLEVQEPKTKASKGKKK